MKYSQTIGVLGGMGSYATLYLFERLLDSFPAEKEWDRPRIVIDNNCTMPSRVRAILYKEKQEQLISEMSMSINKLVESGAEKIIIGCITAHCFFEKLPHQEKIIHMVRETANRIEENDVFVLCTEGSVEVGIWANELKQCNVIYPDENQMILLREFIEIVKQRKITEQARRDFLNYINLLPYESVVLGCTELPVLLDKTRVNKTIFDPFECTISCLKNELVRST